MPYFGKPGGHIELMTMDDTPKAMDYKQGDHGPLNCESEYVYTERRDSQLIANQSSTDSPFLTLRPMKVSTAITTHDPVMKIV
jgi:hypothetical protein